MADKIQGGGKKKKHIEIMEISERRKSLIQLYEKLT